jgi:hypothetical protein
MEYRKSIIGDASDGPPGPRPHYYEWYYAAFVRDPDGNCIEAVTFLRDKAEQPSPCLKPPSSPSAEAPCQQIAGDAANALAGGEYYSWRARCCRPSMPAR